MTAALDPAAASTTAEFIAGLRTLGVELLAEGDLLRYRAPHGVLTPELRARLAARKGEIVEHLRGAAHGVAPCLAPAVGDRIPPLSAVQQRFWLLERLEPGNPAHHAAVAMRLVGELDVRALQQSFDEIVRRHEILRTTYVLRDGEAAQVVLPPATLAMQVIDLAERPAAQRESELAGLMAAESGRPFDLASGPVLRPVLIRAGADDHLLVLAAHLSALDGWSLAVLLRELETLYGAFHAGTPSPLREPAAQYKDFALWQDRWVAGETVQAQASYWRSRLAGAPATLSLPADRPRPAARTQRGATRPFVMSPDASAAVRRLGRDEGATPFVVFLAAFQALLARHSGQDDVVVATVVSIRQPPETEEMLGSFANVLLLRTGLGGAPTFRELVHRSRETVTGALAHQDLPFECLARDFGGHAGEGTLPDTSAVLIFHGVDPLHRLALPGLTVTPVPVDTGWTKPDLQLTICDQGDQFAGGLQYSADRFEAITIDRLLAELQGLLRTVTTTPEARILDPGGISARAPAASSERALPSRPHRAPVIPAESIPSAESVLPERNLRPDSRNALESPRRKWSA